MSDISLALIAFAVLVMAAIQVALLVVAARTAQKVGDTVSRLERDLRPVVESLQTMTAEATRMAASASARIERADRAVLDLTRRVDDAVRMLQGTVLRPARQGAALVHGVLAVLAAMSARRRAAKGEPEVVEEDESLFIG